MNTNAAKGLGWFSLALGATRSARRHRVAAAIAMVTAVGLADLLVARHLNDAAA